MFVLNSFWKARRKDKDQVSGCGEKSKQYLESALLATTTAERHLRDLVQIPNGIDYNEWLASHTIAFFEHINLIYGTICEFCNSTSCPEMNGPGNRVYHWMDEKGKCLKLPASTYTDYVMTFTQKCVNDESLFPTKFDREFPATFESLVRRVLRLLFQVMAHMYHSHFRELVLLDLHQHLNCLFAHFALFVTRYKLIDDKEFAVLEDLAMALNLISGGGDENVSGNSGLESGTSSTTPPGGNSSPTNIRSNSDIINKNPSDNNSAIRNNNSNSGGSPSPILHIQHSPDHQPSTPARVGGREISMLPPPDLSDNNTNTSSEGGMTYEAMDTSTSGQETPRKMAASPLLSNPPSGRVTPMDTDENNCQWNCPTPTSPPISHHSHQLSNHSHHYHSASNASSPVSACHVALCGKGSQGGGSVGGASIGSNGHGSVRTNRAALSETQVSDSQQIMNNNVILENNINSTTINSSQQCDVNLNNRQSIPPVPAWDIHEDNAMKNNITDNDDIRNYKNQIAQYNAANNENYQNRRWTSASAILFPSASESSIPLACHEVNRRSQSDKTRGKFAGMGGSVRGHPTASSTSSTRGQAAAAAAATAGAPNGGSTCCLNFTSLLAAASGAKNKSSHHHHHPAAVSPYSHTMNMNHNNATQPVPAHRPIKFQ